MTTLAPSTAPPVQPTADGPPSGVQLTAAFAARVPEYAERGRFWARRLRIPAQEVDDLVQEVLKAMWEHLSELSPHVWLAWFDTAFQHKNKRRRRDHARWKNNEPTLSNAAIIALHPNCVRPVTVFEARWQVAKVGRIIDGLEPELHEVARRYLLENEPMDRIAASLAVSVNTIKNRWRLAREAVEEQIERERAKEWLRLGKAGAFLLFLLGRVMALFRPDDATLDPRAAGAPRSGDTVRAARRWASAAFAFVPLSGAAVLVALAVHCGSPPQTDVPSIEMAFAAEEPDIPILRPVLHAWAEREIESSGVSSTPARPARAASPLPAARAATVRGATLASAQGAALASAPPEPPLLSKAREALRLGHFSEAAAALRDFEVDHPDPTKNALHRDLRVELGLRSLDAAPLIQ